MITIKKSFLNYIIQRTKKKKKKKKELNTGVMQTSVVVVALRTFLKGSGKKIGKIKIQRKNRNHRVHLYYSIVKIN